MKIIEESEEFIEKRDDDLYWYHNSMNPVGERNIIEYIENYKKNIT